MKITEVIKNKDINENPDSITNYELFRYGDEINWDDKDAYAFGYIDGEFIVTGKGEAHDSRSRADDKGNIRRSHYKYAGRIWTFNKIISFWQYPPPDMIIKVIGDLRKKLNLNINDTYKIETLPNKVTDIDRFKGNYDWNRAYHDEIEKAVFLTPTEYSKLGNVEQPSAADRAKQHSLSPMLKGKSQGTPKTPIPIQQKFQQRAEGKINLNQIIKEEIEEYLKEDPDRLCTNGEYLDNYNCVGGDANQIMHNANDSIAFGIGSDGNMMTTVLGGNHFHSVQFGSENSVGRGSFKYPGRAWLNSKYISFWVYPPPHEIEKFIHMLEYSLNNDNESIPSGSKIDIWNNPKWKIELAIKDKKFNNDDESPIDAFDRADWKNIERNDDVHSFNTEIIPLRNYAKLGASDIHQRSREELAKPHREPSKDYGGGSKLTGSDQPQNLKYRQALRQESLDDEVE